jgi:hypothetical protein
VYSRRVVTGRPFRSIALFRGDLSEGPVCVSYTDRSRRAIAIESEPAASQPSETGLPTDYNRQEIHADLFSKADIIRTSSELVLRIAAWRTNRR